MVRRRRERRDLGFNQGSWSGTSGEVSRRIEFFNNGTAFGGATTNPNKGIGGAGQFDGLNDGVRIADSNSLDFASTFTVGLWFNLTSAFTASSKYGVELIDKGVFTLSLDRSDEQILGTIMDNSAASWATSKNVSVQDDVVLSPSIRGASTPSRSRRTSYRLRV